MTCSSNPPSSVLALAGSALLIASGLLNAGPLTPPIGPVSSTGKTTQEIFDKVAAVEPRIAINATNTPGDADSLYKITQRGSYYLAGNVAGVVGKHGIEVAASGVTIDLNGFDLSAFGTLTGVFDGITVSDPGLTNITVLNGSLRQWGRDGINFGDLNATGCRVEGVITIGNARMGVYSGTSAVVSNCSGSGGQYGIYARTGSVVSGCTAAGTTVAGIITDTGAEVTHCAAYSNVGSGFIIDAGSSVSDCSALQNTAHGFRTGFGCTIVGCSASNNSASGINAGSGSTVSNCTAYTNGANGILTGSGCTVSNSSVFSNNTNGISTGNGCTIADCTARFNALDGIVVFSECVIRGNICSNNGSTGNGAGIHTLGEDNRIEGNTCVNADRGIDVDLAGNIIIRNYCTGNGTNWDVVAGNACLVIQAVNSGAIVGNTGGASIGSSDPNANFSY